MWLADKNVFITWKYCNFANQKTESTWRVIWLHTNLILLETGKKKILSPYTKQRYDVILFKHLPYFWKSFQCHFFWDSYMILNLLNLHTALLMSVSRWRTNVLIATFFFGLLEQSFRVLSSVLNTSIRGHAKKKKTALKRLNYNNVRARPNSLKNFSWSNWWTTLRGHN